MKIKAYILTWVMIVGLASCSNSDVDSVTNTTAGQISLSAGIELEGRAATNVLQTNFSANNRIGVYINEVTSEPSPSVVYPQPIEYRITNTSGKMTRLSGADPYYPVNGHDVKINAFFPYAAITPTGVYTIGTSQVSRTEYEACDLMAATVTGRDESAPLTLTFKHLASKITVNLSTTQSGISLSYSKIKLLNLAREAHIDAAEGVITSVSGSKTDPVLISNDGRTASSGIILPQIVSANTRFIEIELLTKEKVYGIMPTTYTFLPGKSYVFNIDVVVDRDASEFTLNDIQIVDWVNEPAQEIEGERTN
jgi:hypothetical protein